MTVEKLPSKWRPPFAVPRPDPRPTWDALEPPQSPPAAPERERDTVPPRESIDGGEGGAELDTQQLIRLVTANTVQTQALKGSVDTLYEALMAHVRADRSRVHERCPTGLQWLAVAMSACAIALASWALLRTTSEVGLSPIGCALAAEVTP